jgi:ferredoxin
MSVQYPPTVGLNPAGPQGSIGRVAVAAVPLPGTHVTHPVLLLLSAIVLVATMFFWVATSPRRGRGRRGPSVTVNVDPVRCARFGYCEHEAPDVFQIRREGRLTYEDRVPVDEIDPVIRAAGVCPARAITLGKMPRR